MKFIPVTKDTPVLRTDFSNDALWDALCTTIQEPVGEFRAYVTFISDPVFASIMVEQVLSLIPQNLNHSVIFVVDQFTLSLQDYPILVVDLDMEPGRTFRVIPSEIWGVENNLSIANMDFADFADSTDQNGIFRGFPDH